MTITTHDFLRLMFWKIPIAPKRIRLSDAFAFLIDMGRIPFCVKWDALIRTMSSFGGLQFKEIACFWSCGQICGKQGPE
jgi:hypothetical protein